MTLIGKKNVVLTYRSGVLTLSLNEFRKLVYNFYGPIKNIRKSNAIFNGS